MGSAPVTDGAASGARSDSVAPGVRSDSVAPGARSDSVAPGAQADSAPGGGAAAQAAIGIDLGGTTMNGLLVRGDGRVLARRRRDTPAAEGPEAVLRAMRDMAAGLLEEADRLITRVIGLGLGIPGPIDVDRGVCLFSPNLGWRDLDAAAYFRQAFDRGPDPADRGPDPAGRTPGRSPGSGLPVRLDNDVRVATLGEAWLGAGREFRTFVCLTIGTGIGSGVILDGRLWRGPGWSAGEVGHIPVAAGPDAPLCGCGRRGCLEAVASGTAIAREAEAAVARGERTLLGETLVERPLTARDVAEAARRGDRVAGSILDRAAVYLGTGIATVVSLFNPEAVIVGGGVAGAWDLLGPVVERTVRERTFPPNLASLRGVFPAALGEDAGAIGAASLFLAPWASSRSRGKTADQEGC